MNIKEMIGDFDSIQLEGEFYRLETQVMGEPGSFRVTNKRTGKSSIFDFSKGAPSEMRFFKEVMPKNNVKKDFEKLVRMIEGHKGMIFIQSVHCEGFSPISELHLLKGKSVIFMRVDKSNFEDVKTPIDTFLFDNKNPTKKIDFHGNQATITFDNEFYQTLEFRPNKQTKVKIL